MRVYASKRKQKKKQTKLDEIKYIVNGIYNFSSHNIHLNLQISNLI